MHDLFASWERAGAGDLSDFTDNWLRTAGPDTIDARPGGRRRPAYAARRTTPPTGRTRIRAAVAARTAPGPTTSLELDAPETPFDAGDRPVLLDPYSDTWALLIPDQLTMDALESLLPHDRRRPCSAPGVWNNVRSGPPQRRRRPGRRARRRRARACRSRTPRTAARRTMPWVLRLGRAAAARPGRGAGPAAHAAARQGSTRAAPGSERAAGGVPGRDRAPRPTRPCSAAGWPASDLPDGVAARPRPALAGAGPAGDAGRRRPRPSSTGSSPPSPPAVARVEPRRRARASLPDAGGQGLGLGAASPARSTCPTTSSRRPASACGAAARRQLTEPYVERYFADLPETVKVRSGWVLADAAEDFFPRTSLTRADPGAGRRRSSPTATWTCPCAAGWSTRRTTSERCSPCRAYPARDRAGRVAAGPTVRTRVHELGTEGERRHEDRLATEEPLEIRLAWPGAPPRRVWVTMRTPGHDFELAAGWLVHEGLATAPPRTIAYCTDADLTPEQEFNVVTVTLDVPPTRDPAHRHDARRPARRRAGSAARTASPRRWPRRPPAGGPVRCPRPDVVRTPPGPAARGPARSSTRTGGVHAAALATAEGELLVVREDVGRHNAVDKVTGARVLAGQSPRRGLPRRQRPGRLRAGPEGGGRRASVRSSRSARRPVSPSTWPRRPGSCSTGSPRPERTVRYA